MQPLIVGIGEILWDVVGETKTLGGAPANFAYHASHFGLDAHVVSAVGNDNFGNEIIEKLNRQNLKYNIAKVAQPTGKVKVMLNTQGVPDYEICANAAWDNIPFSSSLAELAQRAQAVCFGSLAQRSSVSRNTINKFLSLMPNNKNCYKIFDANFRQNFYNDDIVKNSINQCNILKLNEDEFPVVANILGCDATENFEKNARKIISDYNLQFFILTRGSRDSFVFAPNKTSHINTPKVKIADTVGAGDSFTAAFCASLICGKSIEIAHQIAVDVSAFVCSRKGAMPLYTKSF